MSRPSGPFLVRCCGDTTQLSATVYSTRFQISFAPTVWTRQRVIPLQVPVTAATCLLYSNLPVVQGRRHAQILNWTSNVFLF